MMGALRILLHDEKLKKFQATYTTLRNTPASNSESVLPTKPKKQVERSPIAKVKSLEIKKSKHDGSSCSSPLRNKPASNSKSVLPTKPKKHVERSADIDEVKSFETKELKHDGSIFTESFYTIILNHERRIVNLENIIGAQSKSKGETNEKAIRLLVANEKGEHYSKSVKFNNLVEAVENISVVSGLSNVKQKSILVSCKKVVNYLKDHDIYKEFLRWFYDQVKKRAQANNNQNLVKILHTKPWVLVDDVLSLGNVRDSIPHLDQDFKESLKFLENGVMWENPEFVSSSSGHGLVLAMFASAYQICPKILSFPPAAKIEQDCRGKIAIQSGTVRINIGEIKSSKTGVYDAKKQLKRSLLFSSWLHKIIHVQPFEYELGGDIFWSEELKGPQPQAIIVMDKEAPIKIKYTKFIFRKSVA